jgi:hypothetical protein
MTDLEIATAPEEIFELPKPVEEEPSEGYVKNSRYYLPDPDRPEGSQKEIICTRATTWAKTVSDTFTLNQWGLRMALKGVALAPSIVTRVAAIMNERLDPGEEKARLQPITEEAKNVAAAREPAEQGTGVHKLAEQLDAGMDPMIPEPWDRDLRAYELILKAGGLTPDPQFMERIVLVRKYKVAGKLDRIVWMAEPCKQCGRIMAIGDLKTGRDLQYGWNEIAVQLGIYSHADLMLDYETGAFEPMPEVCPHIAYVFHIPVTKGIGTLYEVDVEAGWYGSELTRMVKDWRNRRDLAVPTQMFQVDGDAETGYTETNHFLSIEDRINLAASVEDLRQIWREAKACGQWNKALEKLAKDRQKSLTA